MELTRIRREFRDGGDEYQDFLLLLDCADKFRECAEMMEMRERQGQNQRDVQQSVYDFLKNIIEFALKEASMDMRDCALELLEERMTTDLLHSMIKSIEKREKEAAAILNDEDILIDYDDHPF